MQEKNHNELENYEQKLSYYKKFYKDNTNIFRRIYNKVFYKLLFLKLIKPKSINQQIMLLLYKIKKDLLKNN
jgi:hypothetical protein